MDQQEVISYDSAEISLKRAADEESEDDISSSGGGGVVKGYGRYKLKKFHKNDRQKHHMMIVNANDYHHQFNRDVMRSFQPEIEAAIDVAIRDGTAVPQFWSNNITEGYFHVTCANKDTATWLRSIVENPKFVTGQYAFKLIHFLELPMRRFAEILGCPFGSTVSELENGRRQIAQCNNFVNTDQWTLYKRKKSEILVRMSQADMDEIERRNWELRCGNSTIAFMFEALKDEEDQLEEDAEDKSEAEDAEDKPGEEDE